MKKRACSILLTLCMVFSMLPSFVVSANAVGELTLLVDSAAEYSTTPERAENTTYKTVAEAIAAAVDGDTIQLNSTISCSSILIGSKNLTIDFNGYQVTCSSTSYGLNPYGTTNLTLMDSAGNNAGGITMTGTAAPCIKAESTSAVTVESGSYRANNGACVQPINTATITLNNGIFTSASACVYNEAGGAKVFVNGGSFTGSLNASGGPIFLTPAAYKTLKASGNNLYSNIYIRFPSGENTMTEDLDLDTWQLRVLSGDNTTIDLNGYNITGNGMSDAPTSGGVVAGAVENLYCLCQIAQGGALTIKNTGACDASHGRIYNDNDKVLFTFKNYGDLTLDGNIKVETKVSNATKSQGSSIYMKTLATSTAPLSTVTINEGVEIRATAQDSTVRAYALYVDSGEVRRQNSPDETSVTINGGALYGETSVMQMSGRLAIYGGTFQNSSATVEAFYLGWPAGRITNIENAVIESSSTGIWIGGQVVQSENILIRNTTINQTSASPIGTALINESASKVIVSGKNTYWVSDSKIYDNAPYSATGGTLEITAGVFSQDPSDYVSDSNSDGVKDYAVLDYADASVANYYLVAPWTRIGVDNKVDLYYSAGATAKTVAKDDVAIAALADIEGIVADPSLVRASHFTLSASSSEEVAIDGLSVSAFKNGNRLTIAKEKQVDITSAYVWYGGRNIGEIEFTVKNGPTYDIGGEITGAVEKPTAYLIRDGIKYDAIVSGTANPYEYTVKNVPAGEYNLVVCSVSGEGTLTTTVLVTVVNQAVAQNVVLPSHIYNSIVTTTGENTPNVEAGGLDKIAETVGEPAENTYVKIELKVTENESSEHADDVKSAISGSNMIKGIILDADVLKTVNAGSEEKITEITEDEHGIKLIKVVFHLPEALQNKDSYAIFRYHAAAVDKITENPNTGGEYMLVNDNKDTITAYLCKFSTYSIAYAQRSTVTFDANGGTCDIATQMTDGEGKLSSLPSATKSGTYRFDGWFTAANGGAGITASTVFTDNTVVFAHWTYTGGDGGSANTGDNFSLALWTGLAIMSVSGLAYAVYRKRRQS